MVALTSEELDAVSRLLLEAGEERDGPLRSSLIAGGRSNLTYRLEDGRSAWVLRRPPVAGRTASAHDVAREFTVCRALAGTSVPVARAVAQDHGETLGSPIAVFSYVDGIVVRSRSDAAAWSPGHYDRCARGLIDTLVALHEVDVDAVGLGNFARRTDHPGRQLRRWAAQWQEMKSSHTLEERLRRLLETRVPDDHRLALVHGDYRVDNVLLDDGDAGHVLAVVDWELSTLGDPVSDLALMAAYRHPALDGVLGLEAAWTDDRFPGPGPLRSSYEEVSGRRAENWEFHLALAFYKLAAIAEGIAHRQRVGGGPRQGREYEALTASIPAFLGAGLEVLRAHG